MKCDTCGKEIEVYPYKIDGVVMCFKCFEEWGKGIESREKVDNEE